MNLLLDTLQKNLCYRFSDRTLLEAALTHRSFLNESSEKGLYDNERLEFLGDSVLSLFISLALFNDFPLKREGELSRIRSAIVDEDALAMSAEALEIGKLLRLGKGEISNGGRSKKSLLADSFEALIAAIYIDGGAEGVAPVIENHYRRIFSSKGDLLSGRDCKSSFQEKAQSIAGATPIYRVIAESGPDHAKTFKVAAYLCDELLGEGEGRSKKEAEQEAARRGLEKLNAPVDSESA